MRNLLFLLVLLGVVLSLGVSVQAKTPDGITPAEETVCDGEVGAAYGLCNAYCEAMDCDSDYPKASEKACNRVLANYEKKTDGGIPPCIDPCAALADVAECPCDYLSLIPQTVDCWGFESGPEFRTSADFCFTQNSVFIMDPIPSEMTTYVGSGVGAFGVGFDCTMRIVGNPSCSTDALNMTIGLNSTEYTTCNCRVEQYTNKLADQPWSPTFTGEQPPFTCSN